MGLVGSLLADLRPSSVERSSPKQTALEAVPAALPPRRAPVTAQGPAMPPADDHGSSDDDEADDLTQHQVFLRMRDIHYLECSFS